LLVAPCQGAARLEHAALPVPVCPACCPSSGRLTLLTDREMRSSVCGLVLGRSLPLAPAALPPFGAAEMPGPGRTPPLAITCPKPECLTLGTRPAQRMRRRLKPLRV
jgi:hypothetical protein